ncbi:hypothetical protein Ga0080559_TMP2992 [Salipiger profundus]|uniref:Uncharacterized protein n=1 Tax=Salipiger profundus TaxID=1229727 RepID=A0A1U7D6P9_9RHOB|nr:hypothetical protein Ga0080559_TMP2992 [Salipiger profundus]
MAGRPGADPFGDDGRPGPGTAFRPPVISQVFPYRMRSRPKAPSMASRGGETHPF